MPQEHRKSPTLPPEPKRENPVSLDPPRGGVKVWGAQRKGLQRWRPEAVITVTLSLIIFFIKKLHYHGLSCKQSHNKGLWADGLLETWFWGGGEKDRGHGQGTLERRYKRELDQPQPWIMSALLPWSLVRSLKKCVRCSAWRKASHRKKTRGHRGQLPVGLWCPMGCLCLSAGQTQQSNGSPWQESLPRD